MMEDERCDNEDDEVYTHSTMIIASCQLAGRDNQHYVQE